MKSNSLKITPATSAPVGPNPVSNCRNCDRCPHAGREAGVACSRRSGALPVGATSASASDSPTDRHPFPHLAVPKEARARLRDGLEHLLACVGQGLSLDEAAGAAGGLLADEIHGLTTAAAAMAVPRGLDAFVVDGLPVDASLEATPLGNLVSLGLAKLLGEPFGFAQKKGGHLVSPLRVRPGFEGAPNNGIGSGRFSEHSDNAAFAPDFCGDAFILLGLRNDAQAPTSYVPRAALVARLIPELVQVLSEPRFVHPVTDGFAFRMAVATRPAPILRRGPEGEWQIALSAGACHPADAGDREAAAALAALTRLAADPALAIPVVIGPGRALIVSNRRGLHARAAFQGTRLVLRTYVAWDLTPFRAKTGENGPVFDAWALLK